MLFSPFNLCFYTPYRIYNNQVPVIAQSLNSNDLKRINLESQKHLSPHQNRKTGIASTEKYFYTQICKILEKTNSINAMLNILQKNIFLMEEELNHVNYQFETIQKEDSAQTFALDPDTCSKNHLSVISSNRTHPKIKLMQKIFGKKQYQYKLAYDGKFPKVLYKQRNISLKILLKDKLGESVINSNQLSLNLKVYRNNGEQIFLDKEQPYFMNGLCQSSMKNGVANFSKIHPKQVSRNFSGKGICIIIYSTSHQNSASTKGLMINASQIQPLIFYNVKVVVKQQKIVKSDLLYNQSDQQT